MARDKLMAGHAVRRLRRRIGITQAAMAETLAISPSYLNLIERNQRSLPAGLLVQLAEQYDFDPRSLTAAEPGGGAEAIRRRLSDPMFADLDIDRHDVEEWLAAAPGGAEAFARSFDRNLVATDVAGTASTDPFLTTQREIERWRNHFPDLDAAAEELADELRLIGADLYGALVERLRAKHGLSIRILPVDVMPDVLRRLDLHARQLQLSEMLTLQERTFELASQLALLEARGEIDALVRGAGLTDRPTERLLRQHLVGYFANAVMMPYARFLRACESTGYNVDILQQRFSADFEQIAQRLTTLQRVGARGLAFFMLRIDRAGQASLRQAGASGSPLIEANGRCPLWRIHHAFDRPGSLALQLVELEDGSRWFTQARRVAAKGSRPGAGWDDVAAEFSIAIGLAVEQAAGLSVANGIDFGGPATPIGLGCRACLRVDCPQRSAAPTSRALVFNERERGLSPVSFGN